MEMFLYYLLRASVLIALFYGFYKLFLAGSTFHVVNRIVLIFISLATFLLPLFRFKLIPEKKPDIVMEMLPADLFSIPITEFVEPQPQMEIPWIQILMVLFAVGFLFAFIRYMAGLVQLFTIIRKSEKQTLGNHTILCVTDENISPFSWMKYIVLPRKEQIGENEAVIRHEMSHLHLQHSWDMFLFDLFTCLFWFNPFSWLLRREIQTVHEFQADEEVLLSGINAKQYQLLLIRKSVGENIFALANNFRRRDLHKRITMMKKEKTNRIKKWNYAMMIPALFLAMVALSVPKLNAKAVEKENFLTGSDKLTVIGQVVDEAIKGQSEIVVSGLVRDKQGPIAGALITIKGSIKGTVTDMEGKFLIKAEVGDILVFTMINYKTVECKVEDDERRNLVVVMEPEIDQKVESDKGVEVTSSNSKKSVTIDTIGLNSGNFVISRPALRLSGDNKPLIILDGKPVANEVLQKIDPKNIESVSILKDKAAVHIYGDKGEHGVVLFTTKNAVKKEKPIYYEADSIVIESFSKDSIKTTTLSFSTMPHPSGTIIPSNTSNKDLSDNNYVLKVQNPDNSLPLIIVDDEKMPKDFQMNSIDASDIESFSILKDQSAIDVYGDEGKNGVIIITKKKTAQNP